MKTVIQIFLLLVSFVSILDAQRDSKTHTRGMLRQTVYNTGELGRALEGSNSSAVGLPEGTSSLEWPAGGREILDGPSYWGYQNSQGSGLVLRAKVNGMYEARACGGITDGSGNAIEVAGVQVLPGPIARTENYPVLADGSLNPAYNPNEAEEIITATYTTTLPMKLSVTQTSRAWSYPGYDAFIITEYDIENTDTVDYTDGFVMFQNALSPSAFGLQRKYGVWNESSTTSRSREEYARYDFSRFMTYVHSRDGFPDVNTVTGTSYFTLWSQPGDRGGLNAPQAVGFLPLHYDTEHLQPKGNTVYAVSDSSRVWDEFGKFKQPYATETNGNRNQDLTRTIALGLDITVHNPPGFSMKSTGASPSSDSANWASYRAPYKSCPWNPVLADPVRSQEQIDYWHGRMKPRAYSTSGYTAAFFHYTSYGPYVFTKGSHLRFAVAHVVGYGPGVAADSVWRDAGGRTAGYGVSNGAWFSPVPSWYAPLTYPNLSSISGITTMGCDYLQSHELPWYAAGKLSTNDPTPVISIRDVADRAIQMYTGEPYRKFDGDQFKPESTPATGVYASVAVPFPAPAITITSTTDAKNIIAWKGSCEFFTVPRLPGAFSHYTVWRSSGPLGPWRLLDSVGVRDPRYFRDQVYAVRDTASQLSQTYWYAVMSHDVTGGRSGMTNRTAYVTKGVYGAPSDAHRSPVNGGVLYDRYYGDRLSTPRFLSWGGSTTENPRVRFRLQIAEDSTFSTCVLDDSTIRFGLTLDSVYTDIGGTKHLVFQSLPLHPGIRYWWRVATITLEPYGVSPWSTVWSVDPVRPIPVAWRLPAGSGGAIRLDSTASPTVGGRGLASSDVIGACFKRNDSLIIGGFAYWGLGSFSLCDISVRSDNSTTPNKEGFSPGDTVHFRVWDAAEGLEYEAAALIAGATPLYQADSVMRVTSFNGTKILSTEVIDGEVRLPDVYALEQNFPNPFNPATAVSYQLPQPTDVSLKVYDVLGREVAVLVDGMQAAGYHRVTFDARGLSSGFYLYLLSAGPYTATRKMLIVR